MNQDSSQSGERPEPARIRDAAGQYFDQGSNCAQSVMQAFIHSADMEGLHPETLHAVTAGLGKGMGRTEGTCGAFAAAALIISAAHARKAGTTSRATRATGTFSKRLKEEFGAITCKELLRSSPLSCREKTARTAAMLAEYLETL